MLFQVCGGETPYKKRWSLLKNNLLYCGYLMWSILRGELVRLNKNCICFLTDSPNFSKSKSIILTLSITNLAMTYVNPCKDRVSCTVNKFQSSSLSKFDLNDKNKTVSISLEMANILWVLFLPCFIWLCYRLKTFGVCNAVAAGKLLPSLFCIMRGGGTNFDAGVSH